MMITRRQGRIINIASEAGLGGKAYLSPCVLSKTALIRLSENVALETEVYGVCVFAICPGAVQTNMTDARFSAEGQKWIPWCQEIFENGLDVPPDLALKLVLQLASGEYDELSGRHISVRDDLSKMRQRCQEIKENRLYQLGLHRLNLSQELEPFILVGQRYILVEINDWSQPFLEHRQALPFLEKDGMYWGIPPDDKTSIRELERMRHEGASAIVFGWSAFWWLDYYADSDRYLRSRFRCVLENEGFVVLI
ncbi:SDR family oxidoreductase [Cyanobacteria bacterium FACHB-63]|nr:SDR family oxidoreductase [Cyanobacteria bacterium FACHB-63]